MKRCLTLSMLLLCALAADARVLSYSPYTDRLAVRAYQSRTTRHFALVESRTATAFSGNSVYGGQVVLYDTYGEHEPRVIYPTRPGATRIYAVGLFQDRHDLPPAILVAADAGTVFSRDGGRSWRVVPGNLVPKPVTDVDYGGPWTHGLTAQVRIGTRAYPFVIATYGGVYAISANGTPKLLFSATNNAYYLDYVPVRILGQNAAGTHFVIETDHMPSRLVIVSVDGKWRSVGPAIPNIDAGWITGDGSVYLIQHYQDGDLHDDYEETTRTLYLYRNGQSQLVAEESEYGHSFAIPTADFNGAWFLDFAEDWQTTLYRHTPGGKLETMWRDQDAPEVEALHAGAAGDKLLVQVHRPREAQDLSFLDPALAIWHVGDPAPAEYDELFLNEGPVKGFVHLDVDEFANGAPFVFDSSFLQLGPPDVVVSPPITGGGDVIQEWGVVRASVKQRLVLQGVSRNAWLTDLVVFNPLDVQQTVDISFIPAGAQIAAAADRDETILLAPNEIRVVADVLGSLFGADDVAGSLILAPQIGVNVNARTYTHSGGGTVGYAIPAIDYFNVTSSRFPVSFAGAFPGPNYDTRLLLTDTTGFGTHADVQGCNGSGRNAASQVAAATSAGGVLELPVAQGDRGGLVVQPTKGSAVAAVIATDRISNDATYFPPDIPAASPRTLPFVASVEAKDGMPALRSDLHLINLSGVAKSISIEVKPYDTNQWPRSQMYSLKPYEARVIEDPLKLFNLKGIARVRYASLGQLGDTAGIRLTSRTYSVGPDGGTYGTLVQPMNSFQGVTAGESLEILTLAGSQRLSLGLVEQSPNPRGPTADVRITIIDDHGATLDVHTVAIASSGGTQIDDLFTKRGLPTPAAARVIIEPLNPQSMVGAYALLTDPVTHDTTYIGANLGAKAK